MKTSNRLLAALALVLGGAALPAGATDDEGRELTAQWWQWALSIPAASSPLLDDTGANCMVGQRGPVWFLAGNFGTSANVQRTCTVPAGTPIFFPVINFLYFNSPNCDQGPEDLSAAEMRAVLDPVVDGASGIEVRLDNRLVHDVRRIKSKVFSVVQPAQALFSSPCLVPGRIYSPAVDDGYYVRLRGLSEGQHHLAFRGSISGFSLDIFYTLNAVKLRDR